MIGFKKRLLYAWQCATAVLARGELPASVVHELATTSSTTMPPLAPDQTRESPPTTAPPSADEGDRAVQLLALLQRDARLVDFVTEDIAAYSDAQVGAAVRRVHESCRQVLERYLPLEPIIASDEGQSVSVPENVDPATTKLLGNTTARPPLRGILRHRGWRVTQVQLPTLPPGTGRTVVAPAEVEIP